MATVLCTLEDIKDGGALAVTADLPDGPVELVLLRRQDQVWAYHNRCPHFSVRLDFEPGQFATYQHQVVMCAHHSALFRYEDGYCIEGPCEGASLTHVPVVVLDNSVVSQID